MRIKHISLFILIIAVIAVCVTGLVFVKGSALEKVSAKSITYNGKEYEIGEDGSLVGGGSSFGSGTEVDPYIYFIGSAERLASVLPVSIGGTSATYVHYVLIDDISLTSDWNPKYLSIGNIFEGNGFTIKNLKINSTNTTLNVGFFAESRGVIRNLNFENVNINVLVSNNNSSGTGGADTTHRGVGVVVGKISGGSTAPTSSNTTTTNGISTNSTGIVFSAAIENVRVKSGMLKNETNRNTGYTYTGGLVGSIEGFGKSTAERFSVDVTRSYCEIDITGKNTTDSRGSVTGGLIGNIGRADQNQSVGSGDGICGANTDVIIDQCYYSGKLIGSAIAGGIIGRCMYTSQRQIYVSITNCYVMGKIETKSTNAGSLASNNVSGACSGGIAGKVRPLGLSGSTMYNRQVFFKNCFVMAELVQAAANGYRGGIVGGQEENNANSAVFGIRNCHYAYDLLYGAGNGEAAKDQFMGSTSSTTGGSLVDSRYYLSADMCTAEFIAHINDGAKTAQNPNPKFFRLMYNGVSETSAPQLTIFSDVFVLTFDASGGRFDVDPAQSSGSISLSESIIYVSFDLKKTLQISGNTLTQEGDTPFAIPVPKRIGYQFEGWSKNQASATGDYLENLIDSAQSTDMHFYAIWSIIEYKFTCSVTMGGPLLSFSGGAYNSTINDTVTIFKEGYIETVKNDAGATFLEWQAYDGSKWVSLETAGELMDEISARYRLSFYDENNKNYFFNEDFIERYGFYNSTDKCWEIRFSANYTSNTTISTKVTADVGQSSYGRIKIDDGEALLSFGAVKIYPEMAGITMTVEVISEKYWLVAGYKLKSRSGIWSAVLDDFEVLNGGAKISVDVIAYSEVSVVFKSQKFDIRVLAIADDGTVISGAAQNQVSSEIGIGDSYTNMLNIYVQLPGARYRLEDGSFNNIKIVNQKKLANGENNIYDTFDAISGRISFSYKNGFDFDFFENYVDYSGNPNGEIVILARYVKQYQVQLEIDETKLITASVLVDGSYWLSIADISDSWFDEQTEIKFYWTLYPNVLVSHISGLVTGDSWNQTELTFTLSENRTGGDKIAFAFNTPVYSILIYAEDVNGERFDDMKFYVDGDENVSAGVEKVLTEGANIIAKDLSLFDYKFVGWFAAVGGELLEIPYAQDLEIAAGFLELDSTFISTYMEGGCLVLVAVYTGSITINIESLYREEDDNFGGKFYAWLVKESGENQIFFGDDFEFGYVTDMNSLIKIVFEPDPYFEVSQDIKMYLNGAEADSLNKGFIIIKAHEFRNIVISFVPKLYNVSLTLKLGNGTIKVDKQISLNKPFHMTFTPSLGFKVAKWSIGGTNPKSAGNMNVYGNTVRINATESWLARVVTGDTIEFNVTVETAIDDLVYIGSGVGGVLIIALLVASILLARLNKKKKTYYAELAIKHKENEKRMDFGKQMQVIKDLTE